MAEPNWPRHATRIGVFEFRRSVRAIWQDKARAFLMAAGLIFPSLILVGFIYLFSGTIRNAGPVTLPPVARGTVGLLWLFGVFILTQRVVSARPRIDAEPLILSTVSARTAVGGLVIAETLRVLAYLGLPTLVLTGGVVYLFGSLPSVLLIPLAVTLLALTAVLVGMILGYAIALLIATVPFVARHKTILGTAAALVVMGGYLLFTLPQFGGYDQAALAWLPSGWLVDLAVLGTPVHGSLMRATAVVVGSLLVAAIGVVVVEREATRLWFTDPVNVDEPSDNESDSIVRDEAETRNALADAISPLGIPQQISRPTRRVAQWSVLRTRRDPRRLNFLLLPVVLVGSSVLNVGMQSGSIGSVLAPATAVLLPWMAGAAFAMNPFGDEGAVLPITLLSVPGTAYVQGMMLPGTLLGLPLVVVATGGTALAGPFSPPVALGLAGAGVFTTVVAVTTAPAVGMRFPRFSAISIGQSREVIPPRLLTTALHFLAVTLPGTFLALVVLNPTLARTLVAGVVGILPAVLLRLVAAENGGIAANAAAWFDGVGTAIQNLDIAIFQLACGGLLLLGGIVVATVSYRLAVRRFDEYSPAS